MAGVAIFCLGFGIFALPSSFPNVLYGATYSQSPLTLSAQPLEFIHNFVHGKGQEIIPFNVSVTLSLPNGGEYKVATPIHMKVTVYLPEAIDEAFFVDGIEVIVDGAVVYGSPWYSYSNLPMFWGEFPSSTNATTVFLSNTTNLFSTNYPIFSLYPNRTLQGGSSTEIWQGEEDVQYSTSGIFGLALNFLNIYTPCTNYYNYTTECLPKIIKTGEAFIGYTLHTPLFITIISNDILETQNNNSITFSLTLFILMFAAIEVRADTKPEKTCYQQEDG
jgi:hypothetical protein